MAGSRHCRGPGQSRTVARARYPLRVACARRPLRGVHQIGYAPRPDRIPSRPRPAPGRVCCRRRNIPGREPADPSEGTRQEPASRVRRPDTGVWLQAAQHEQGRRMEGPPAARSQEPLDRRAHGQVMEAAGSQGPRPGRRSRRIAGPRGQRCYPESPEPPFRCPRRTQDWISRWLVQSSPPPKH